MGEPYLTMSEIETQYPDQWVLVDRIRSDRYQNMLGGHVVASSPFRDPLWVRLELPPELQRPMVIHTGVRPFRVVGSIEPLGHRLVKYGVILALVAGAAWASHALTHRATTPEGVRIFDRVRGRLDEHFRDVQSGRIAKETNPMSGLDFYPLPDDLRRAGVLSCFEEVGMLWYVLPSGALDGRSNSLLKPLPGRGPESVRAFPGLRGGVYYHFQLLGDNWAYFGGG